jgi:hypothetical protein
MSNYEGCEKIDMSENIREWYNGVLNEVLAEIAPMEREGKKIVPKNLNCLWMYGAKAANIWYKAAIKARAEKRKAETKKAAQ